MHNYDYDSADLWRYREEPSDEEMLLRMVEEEEKADAAYCAHVGFLCEASENIINSESAPAECYCGVKKTDFFKMKNDDFAGSPVCDSCRNSRDWIEGDCCYRWMEFDRNGLFEYE